MKLFSLDENYKQMTQNYTVTDAVFAVVLYVIVVLGYLTMGIVYAKTGLYLMSYFNIFSILLCLLILFRRKQKLNTIGITAVHIGKGIVLGVIAGALFSLLNIIPAINAGGKWTGFNLSLLFRVFYYFVIIGLQEEIVFRGYIQTRLYGAVKIGWLAVLICGLMFAAMHIPFQLYQRNSGDIISFLSENYFWLFMTFVWHVVFNFLYRKYNSLTAPTIAHGIMNLSSTLFR